jgi:uncharacterized membrane protein (UPF0127 family)
MIENQGKIAALRPRLEKQRTDLQRCFPFLRLGTLGAILFVYLLGASPVSRASSFPPANQVDRKPIQSTGPESLAVGSDSDNKVVRLRVAANSRLIPVEAEFADTEAKKERGLMFRKSLPEYSGMLFVFDPPAQATFWMKNTRIPLSIGFIDREGRILEIRSMKPFDQTIISSISNRVAYALEVNLGWFDRHGVRLGARIYGIPLLSGNSELHAGRVSGAALADK